MNAVNIESCRPTNTIKPKTAMFLLLLATVMFAGCQDGSNGSSNPCEGITCSGHGTCAVAEAEAVCACDEGFHAKGLECVADEVEDPCLGVSCSDHGDCVVKDGQPLCICENGYHPEELECVENDPADPCKEVDCSGHGTCLTDDNTPYCDCEEGYTAIGLTCVESQQPCLGVDCSGHGTCQVSDNGLPECSCDPGYHPNGLQCVKNDDKDPCEGITCSDHGTCVVDEDDNPTCDCDNGYHAENLTCVPDNTDPCEGITCSDHGTCVVDENDNPTCDCDNGYHAENLTCVPDNIDPCEGISCSGHGACVVVDEAPSCECDPGYRQQGLDCVADTQDSGLPIWFLHITDCHFGESLTAAPLTTTFSDEIVPTIEPVASINTGDVTDGGGTFQWLSYLDSITNAPQYPYFFEIPGNHDKKTDDGQPFLTYSVTGRAGAGFFGTTQLQSSAGLVRVIRVDTADSSINAVNIAGILGNDQAEQILDMISSDTTNYSFSIVAAHHPMVGLEKLRLGADSMQNIIDQSGADVYLCGHTHKADISWLGHALHVTGPSVGKTDPTTYSLVAIDNDGPTVRLVELTATPSWPVVMITSPTDAKLGGQNPRASAFTAGQTIQVRAIAFSPASLSQVEVRVGDGEWKEMTMARKHVFQAEVSLPPSAGEVVLTAKATGSGGTDKHVITIEVQ